MSSFFCNFLCRLLHVTFPEKHTFCGVFVGVNSVRLLVYHSSGTSCHLLYKRRLLQIVSSSEEMPGRAEESTRANDVRPYNEIYDRTRETYT